MQLLRQLSQQLSAAYPSGEASALARWVMEERFGLSLTDLMLDKDSELSSLEQKELQNIAERLLKKEPIQYILGHTLFCDLSLKVAPGVLIPRPETQELVEWICQDHAPQTRAVCKVLDIGTGSGCIALALAHRGFCVEACDVSPEALRIARLNAQQLQLSVSFRQEDILHIDFSRPTPKEACLNVIVSNPPYICHHESAEMEANVLQYEPHIALFVPNDDPLLFYRHIADYALNHLLPGGKLYFEINRAYSQDVCDLLLNKGFTAITLRQDQFDNPRMVSATLPSTLRQARL